MNEMSVLLLFMALIFAGLGLYFKYGREMLWRQELQSRKIKGLPASSLERNPEWDEAMDRGEEFMWLMVGVWVLAALALVFV